ncbi:hypothetical protein ALC56_13937 [Trachymyrmex septentrionalis]|uniref:Uncharacterized protein n=1 Tax=Trachymyrmex septentrionalis TaxID=34720 RepID=A0A195EU75_9HYME|nr:hypothetical protein ALC56_13937 [Trachymyrmex septentrionalis]
MFLNDLFCELYTAYVAYVIYSTCLYRSVSRKIDQRCDRIFLKTVQRNLRSGATASYKRRLRVLC